MSRCRNSPARRIPKPAHVITAHERVHHRCSDRCAFVLPSRQLLLDKNDPMLSNEINDSYVSKSSVDVLSYFSLDILRVRLFQFVFIVVANWRDEKHQELRCLDLKEMLTDATNESPRQLSAHGRHQGARRLRHRLIKQRKLEQKMKCKRVDERLRPALTSCFPGCPSLPPETLTTRVRESSSDNIQPR